MAKKIKQGKLKTFFLDIITIKLLRELSNENNMNMSEFIDWLIQNYYNSKDPIKQLQQLEEQEKELLDKLNEIRKQKEILYYKIEQQKKLKQQREEMLNQALDIIVNKFIRGCDRVEIENIIRYWSFRLNIPFDELSFKAKKRLDEVMKR